MQLEVGYIGKIIRNEFMEENLDAVPYMTTLNGQSFAQAYSQLYQQMFFSGVSAGNVTAQPFLEAALGGAGSAYCAGFTSCTAALASKNTSLIKETAVSDLWSAMNKVSELGPGTDHARPGRSGKYGRPGDFHLDARQQRLGQLQRAVRDATASTTGTA